VSGPRWVLLAALAGAAHLACAAPAALAYAPPKVETMVVGRSAVLVAPTLVTAGAATVRIARRSCAIGPGTPLGALAALRRSGGPAFRLHDYGSCSRRPVDAGGLFVTRIGDEANSGADGWEYKVGHRAGSAGAADPAGPFGTGRRLRSGQRVLWYWCRLSAGDRCQPTLEVKLSDDHAAPGAQVTATVTGYDDEGHGQPVVGATVTVDGAGVATTAADGSATFAAPAAPGSYEVNASAAAATSGFPAQVTVGGTA
jgi:hypothetical protein